MAAILAVGTVGFLHVVHAVVLGLADTAPGHVVHWLRDAALALPLAFLAVWLGDLLSTRLRLDDRSPTHVVARAGIGAALLGLLFVPAVGIHHVIDGALSAGVEPHHAHGMPGHDNALSVGGHALHGLRDAVIAQTAAFPLLAATMLFLAFRARAPRTSSRRPAFVGMLVAVLFAALTGLPSPAAVFGVSSAQAATDPCALPGTPQRTYNVSAINVKITYNRFGDNDPFGFMYVLDGKIDAVRAQEASGRVSTGLRKDAIQPLVIRANLGECVTINFTNRLTGGLDPSGAVTGAPKTSLHVHGVSYSVGSAGSAVGRNPNTMVAPGQSATYRLFLDPSLGEGAKMFHSHGDSRQITAHGLFGTLNAEPAGSVYLDPETAQPLNDSNWEAIIDPAVGPSFRESTIIYHEVGDETFQVFDKGGGKLPLVDPLTDTYRPGTRALNYRSEPFMRRLELANDKSQGYGSYMFGDPATPIPRSYVNEPTKTRLVHLGSEQAHVHHLHGGADRWRRNPEADVEDFATGGPTKTPVRNAQSVRLDSQTISPMEGYNLEHECGAGGCQAAAGDFLFHCHIAEHYIAGMWSFWRVFDTLQDDLAVIPGRVTPPRAADSTGLIGRIVEGKRVVPKSQFTDPTTQVALETLVESQLPPQGARLDAQDATVWDWQRQGTADAPLYVGEPEDTTCWANYCSATPGKRPPITFNPENGRYAWPLFRPHLGKRPPFTGNYHTGAPWLGETTSPTRPDGLCPASAPVRTYNITAITLPIAQTDTGDTDQNGAIYVLNEDRRAVLNGTKRPEPLVIRSNVGDCVALTFSSQLVDNAENDNHSKVNMHSHFIQFDPQASDGVISGMSYEQSLRPYPTENRTLSSATSAGATKIVVSNVARLRVGVFIAIGQGEANIEIRRITAINNGKREITLDKALIKPHGSGESVGVEFTQYRWYSDVDSGTVFWHDHVDGIHGWGHGLFAAHVIEPEGSTYHHPRTGELVNSGSIVDIHTNGSVGVDHPGGSFREFVVFLHNNIVGTGAPMGCEAGSINLRAEPLDRRAQATTTKLPDPLAGVGDAGPGGCIGTDTDDPYVFSSVKYGDPFTPLPRAYVGDPFVIRGLGLGERVEGLRVTGHRFRPERFNANGELTDVATLGISERFDYVLDGGAGGSARMPGDYLYYSTRNFQYASGAWGLLRVHDMLQPDLKPLPGTAPPSGQGFPRLSHTGNNPPPASGPGNPCPATAPSRDYDVSIFQQRLPLGGAADSGGVIYSLSNDESAIKNGTKPTVPLVIRANQGDCVRITLTNNTQKRAGLSFAKVLFDPQGSYGAAIGLNPDSTVAPGAKYTYVAYADKEVGTTIFLNWGDQSSQLHGAYGALVVEPAGSTYTDPTTGNALTSGPVADIHSPTGNFREFGALFHATDAHIGRSMMPYPQQVDGFSSLNYEAAPIPRRLAQNADPALVFSSDVHGDPPTTLTRAYAGDPVRFRVAVPASQNVHAFSIDGHSWPLEPQMTGSEVIYARTVTSGETIDARLVGGAGGPTGEPGDYLYQDHRFPFLRAGLWGIMRVFGSPQSGLMPL
ncbi:MAG: hypothetical protein M3323_10050 [Actinomycetota bacterium]|nr:hypothetical protein [Actinomycetota bacterium]